MTATSTAVPCQHPLREVFAWMFRDGDVLADPPDFLDGLHDTDQLTDKQFVELQTWCLTKATDDSLMTGIGAIDAADAMVAAAASCGLINCSTLVSDPCDECSRRSEIPNIWIVGPTREKQLCVHCLPKAIRDSLPDSWLAGTTTK